MLSIYYGLKIFIYHKAGHFSDAIIGLECNYRIKKTGKVQGLTAMW
jgi:hypothetical protein